MTAKINDIYDKKSHISVERSRNRKYHLGNIQGHKVNYYSPIPFVQGVSIVCALVGSVITTMGFFLEKEEMTQDQRTDLRVVRIYSAGLLVVAIVIFVTGSIFKIRKIK